MDRKPNTTTLLPLDEYRRVIVSFSGGKDSLATLFHLLDLGVERERIELWHQDVDGGPEAEELFDWPCTRDYCREIANALGVRCRFQWKVGGILGEMLREDAPTQGVVFESIDGDPVHLPCSQPHRRGTRRKFPQKAADLSTRWCSAYVKIDVAARAINNDPTTASGPILYVTGERREESENRSRYAEMERHRTTNRKRRVDHWRPILDWNESDVWDALRRHGVVAHPAYRLGFGRTSCLTCIFADSDQWATIQDVAPDRFARLVELETEFGHTLDRKRSLVEMAEAGESFADSGDADLWDLGLGRRGFEREDLVVDPADWTMPSGAFKACGGPS